MAFTLIAHAGAQSSDGTSATTAGINTTGATLIIVATASIHGQSAPVSDSNTNSWTSLTAQDNASSPITTIFYVVNPNVGAGHTFSVNAGGGANRFPAITVTAWSGNAGSPFDVENGRTATTASILTGSVTPSLTNSLVIAAAGHSETFSSTVDSSLTIADNETGAASLAYGLAMSYLIETSVATVNPLWSGDGSGHGWAAAIAVFKSADGVAPGALIVSGTPSNIFKLRGYSVY